MGENEIPELKTKLINGVNITNLDISKIAMICDYLVLDRFNEVSSFIRFEKCFGPLFSKEGSNFLIETYQEICGPKKKYITFGRLILAFTKWKSNSSQNENFNKFMDIVFNNMVKTQDEVIGQLVEGGRIFNTRNNKGRKIITKFSVITDETKNNIQGFILQYDDFFDSNLSSKKPKEAKNITLEINFPPCGRNPLDRDGISHIAGKYSVTSGIIKFLIFKCRSGKTFYIGDITENEGEQIEPFILGTSSCQINSLRIETVKEQLIYLETKFHPSLRLNQKIISFDSIDEKYINDNIINSPLIFEENELQDVPIEKLDKHYLLIPQIADDAFVEKETLTEKICGKDFNEIYKSFLLEKIEKKEENEEDKKKQEEEKEELKKKIFEKTVQRKKLLKIYLNKFKAKENLLALRNESTQPEERINMDKYLAKIKNYRKKINKKIEENKQQNENEKEEKNEEYEKEDWPEDKDKEKEDEKNIKKEQNDEDPQKDKNYGDNNKIEEKNISQDKKEENTEIKKDEERKIEDEPKKEENTEIKKDEEPKNEDEPKKEEITEIKKDEEPKNEDEPKKEEITEIKKDEEPKNEDEPKKEEITEIKKDEEPKNEDEPKKEEITEIKKDEEPKNEDEPKKEENTEIKKVEEPNIEDKPKKEENFEIKIDAPKIDVEPKKEEIIEIEEVKKESDTVVIKVEDNGEEEKKIRLRGKRPNKLNKKNLKKNNEEIQKKEEDKKEIIIEKENENEKENLIKENENENIILEKVNNNNKINEIEKEDNNKIKEEDNNNIINIYEENRIKDDDDKKDKEKNENPPVERKTGICSNCIIV